MNKIAAAILALLVVLVILIAVVFLWYNYLGWQTFAYKTGDNPSWSPSAAGDVSRLRFKDANFTVSLSNGKTVQKNVTPVLNGMAVAYVGATKAAPMALGLDRPLNPFSFLITGFNNKAAAANPSGAPWCTAPPAACTSDAGCPGSSCSCSVNGVCPPGKQGTCLSCKGGAVVTLTGKWRTV